MDKLDKQIKELEKQIDALKSQKLDPKPGKPSCPVRPIKREPKKVVTELYSTSYELDIKLSDFLASVKPREKSETAYISIFVSNCSDPYYNAEARISLVDVVDPDVQKKIDREYEQKLQKYNDAMAEYDRKLNQWKLDLAAWKKRNKK